MLIGFDYNPRHNQVNTKKRRARYDQGCYDGAMFRGDRLTALLHERGISQNELARRVGVSQSTIWKLASTASQGSKHIHRIAAELGTSPAYLMNETDDPQPGAIGASNRIGYNIEPWLVQPDRADIVWLKEVEQVLGAGGGFFDESSEERLVPFPAHWLRSSVQGHVQSLVTMPCKGTSMEPTILDGNLCIIDTSRTRIDEQDEIWACAYAGLAVIKRLRQMPDGTVKLMSDNHAVRDEIASDGELFILGRCVNVLRST